MSSSSQEKNVKEVSELAKLHLLANCYSLFSEAEIHFSKVIQIQSECQLLPTLFNNSREFDGAMRDHPVHPTAAVCTPSVLSCPINSSTGARSARHTRSPSALEATMDQ